MSTYDVFLTKAADDPAFRQRLVANPEEAAAELGISIPVGMHLVVHEDTAHELNLVIGGQAADIPDEAQRLLSRAQQDAAFRQSLIRDPATTARTEIGIVLPPTLNVRVHENTDTVCHLVLPPAETAAGELSDMELESVAGGKRRRRSRQTPLPPGLGSISGMASGRR